MLLRETQALDMLHAEALAWTKLHERRKREDGSEGHAPKAQKMVARGERKRSERVAPGSFLKNHLSPVRAE